MPRSSGSVSMTTVDEEMVMVGDSEVKMRKSKKKKKRSSMIFISEEKEGTSTMSSKRVGLNLKKNISKKDRSKDSRELRK